MGKYYPTFNELRVHLNQHQGLQNTDEFEARRNTRPPHHRGPASSWPNFGESSLHVFVRVGSRVASVARPTVFFQKLPDLLNSDE